MLIGAAGYVWGGGRSEPVWAMIVPDLHCAFHCFPFADVNSCAEKEDSTCPHIHMPAAPTCFNIEGVEENSDATPRQTLKTVVNLESNRIQLQSCGAP